MVKVIRTGNYTLIETNKLVKILILDDIDTFAWIDTKQFGEILVTSHKEHKTDYVLAKSKYRMYDVKKEPNLTGTIHLELYAGNNLWQGYILPTGLPTDEKIRARIIPTPERITIAAF